MIMRSFPQRFPGRVLVAAAVVVVGAGALSGCGNTKRALGLEKQAPDEFAVVARAPLAVPPEFNLRPPEPGAPRPQEGSTADQARATLLGQPAGTQSAAGGGALSGGEKALLASAKTDTNVADIRSVVNRETSSMAAESDRFTDSLIFWQDKPEFGTVVDPAKEAQRLREAQALGESVSNGETPVIERREKGWLEGVF